MKLSQLIGKRTKDSPKDALTKSHKILVRGGYIRPVAAGIYSILPLGKRIIAKIEKIIREEMDAIGGQEVLMPVVMPRTMWEQSGRYNVIGKEMVRFKDRNNQDMLLGMTHEECVVTLARDEMQSYRDYPAMLYQIQTKFRDEPRPRAGLIRVREFTMKDAYSFHTEEDDLKSYYKRCYDAYERIFRRAGVKNLAIVQSDTGMMGGSVAHEFMLVCDIGEDTLVTCSKCDYAANNEVAVAKIPALDTPSIEALAEVATPNCKTIEQLCKLLKIEKSQTIKAVFFKSYSLTEKVQPSTLYFALTRGDKEINEVKLSKIVKSEIKFAQDEEIRSFGAVPGYASPVGLKPSESLKIIIDPIVMGNGNFVVGANKEHTHLTGFNAKRDLTGHDVVVADISKVDNDDPCPSCGGALRLCRGIEIGNIFQLGEKYSKSMGMSYLTATGSSETPIMGCYGIGVGRLMASVLEESCDERGAIWPAAIAPYAVHICALNYDREGVREAADRIYAELSRQGIEVILDETNNRPGVQFADAELIGAPIRITVGERSLAQNEVEYNLRDGSEKGNWKTTDAVANVSATLRKLLAK